MTALLRRLLPLALLTPFAAAQADLETAHMEVHRGRVVLLNGGSGERTLRTGDTHLSKGSTHIEVGTGAEVRLSWPGTGSLHVWGPSSVQWQTEKPADDAPAGTPRTLKWTVQELAWCDLEVRRGQHKLALPGSWTAKVGPSAVYLRGLPSGPVELRLHAGNPVRLDWSGDVSQARPPVMVNPGSSVRLERPSAAPADKSSQAKAWDRGANWPYRKTSDTARQRAERETLSRRTQRQDPWPAPSGGAQRPVNEGPITRGKASERVVAPKVVVDADPLPALPLPQVEVEAPVEPVEVEDVLDVESVEVGAVQPEVVAPVLEPVAKKPLPQAPVKVPAKPVVVPVVEPVVPSVDKPVVKPVNEPAPVPVVAPEPVQAPKPVVLPSQKSEQQAKPETVPSEQTVEPQPEPVATPFVKEEWGGLEKDELISCGKFAVEEGLGVEVRMFGGGRHKVLVDSKAAGPIRVFTSVGDQRMYPGAVAVFESDGAIRMAFGKIEPLGVVQGRAEFVDVK